MSSSSAPGAWWWPLLVELPLAAAKLVGAVPGGGSFPGGIPGTAWLMSVALPCAAWAEPLWAVSTGSWGAFGVAGAALKGVLLLSVAFWLMSFNFWFLWLNIFFYFLVWALCFLPYLCKTAVFLPQISLQLVSGYCLAMLFMRRPTSKRIQGRGLYSCPGSSSW